MAEKKPKVWIEKKIIDKHSIWLLLHFETGILEKQCLDKEDLNGQAEILQQNLAKCKGIMSIQLNIPYRK